MERIMIFIDGSNLFFGAKIYEDSLSIDFKSLREMLAADRDLRRAYYYGSIDPEENPDQVKFYDFLQHNGFKTIIEPVRERKGSKIEKGADTGLVTDMLSLGFQDSYDTAIIVSGDADFKRAIQVVQSRGLRVEIASFRENLSNEIQKTADKSIILNNHVEKFKR
ncbi:MAG: NYN domain-containing protein [Candidatus Nanohaloarchaea archaeon]|nr:NYN domain-containing protein [Candidatus Nanohaloarchaea archaeon]